MRPATSTWPSARSDCTLLSQKAAVQYLAESVTAPKLEAALRQAQTVVDFADRQYRER